MSDEAAQALVQAVRRKLRITYEDEATNGRVADIIADGTEDLRYTLGIEGEFDFAQPGMERSLLLDWCFYAWNDATDDFHANFAAKLEQCRQKWMVMQFAEEEADS